MIFLGVALSMRMHGVCVPWCATSCMLVCMCVCARDTVWMCVCVSVRLCLRVCVCVCVRRRVSVKEHD